MAVLCRRFLRATAFKNSWTKTIRTDAQLSEDASRSFDVPYPSSNRNTVQRQLTCPALAKPEVAHFFILFSAPPAVADLWYPLVEVSPPRYTHNAGIRDTEQVG